MNIHFYLNDAEEDPIVSFYDLDSNPFALNDIVHLSVEDFISSKYDEFHKTNLERIALDNKEKMEKYDLRKLKLVRESKHVSFNVVETSVITIEYHCEIVE